MASENCSGNRFQPGMYADSPISVPNILANHNAIVTSASARNRLAVLFFLLANHKSAAKASAINIPPRKATSYKLIWK